MTTTLLISEAKVRAFTDINDSVDSELIKNNIRLAGDYYLQNILGTLLYRKLISDVEAQSVTGYYKTLLDDYSQDYLLYATYYETLESIYLRPRNNGLLIPQGGDNSQPVDRSVYDMKRQSVENKMAYYGQRLTEYIIEEEVHFPELDASNKLYDQNPDYTTKYKNPFVMKGGVNAFKGTGIPLYDSSRKQYPQNYDNGNDGLPV